MPVTTTTRRFFVVWSMNAPARLSSAYRRHAHRHHCTDRACCPALLLEEHAEERADASLHIGHKEVEGLQSAARVSCPPIEAARLVSP